MATFDDAADPDEISCGAGAGMGSEARPKRTGGPGALGPVRGIRRSLHPEEQTRIPALVRPRQPLAQFLTNAEHFPIRVFWRFRARNHDVLGGAWGSFSQVTNPLRNAFSAVAASGQIWTLISVGPEASYWRKCLSSG